MSVDELIGEVTASLMREEIPFEVLSEDDDRSVEAVRWLQCFPIEPWGRIRWSDVSRSVCLRWNDQPEMMEALMGVRDRLPNAPGTRVMIMWSNAARPIVCAPLTAVWTCAAEILNTDFDAWILCPSGGWCIEKYHEGELCYGFLPSPMGL